MGLNMKMLRKMQNQMEKMQEELGQQSVEGTAGGGAVVVTVTGHQKILSIKITPDVVDPHDVQMLEDLILTAVNDGLAKSQDLASKRLGSLTSGLGLNIPGF